MLLRLAGDVERDFWLAFDLLRNPKDHAEFTVRIAVSCSVSGFYPGMHPVTICPPHATK